MPGHSRVGPVGQGLVEYGLILSLIAVVGVVVTVILGGTLAQVLAFIGSAIDSST